MENGNFTQLVFRWFFGQQKHELFRPWNFDSDGIIRISEPTGHTFHFVSCGRFYTTLVPLKHGSATRIHPIIQSKVHHFEVLWKTPPKTDYRNFHPWMMNEAVSPIKIGPCSIVMLVLGVVMYWQDALDIRRKNPICFFCKTVNDMCFFKTTQA